MTEVCYYLADDGKKFDDRWECMEYERGKTLDEYKDEFQFFNYRKEPIPIEEATVENVMCIVVKTDEGCTEAISNWFKSDSFDDPFYGTAYGERVGTWVYGDLIDRGDEWIKLELAIEKLQTLINKINQ